jgi:hypothetical protein
MRNGQLGKQIYEDVRDGKIPKDEAVAAVSVADTPPQQQEETTPAQTVSSESPPAMPSEININPPQSEQAVSAMPHQEVLGAANQMVDILEQLMASAASAGSKAVLDADTVRSIVKDVLKTEAVGIHTVEIKTGDSVIGKVEGKTHIKFEHVLKTVSTRVQGRRLHVWAVGPSGSGKSYLASQVAKALSLNYYSTSAIQSKYDLIGFVSPTGAEATLRTPFRNAFENGGLFAWDDIDASDPRAFVAFNEALSNGRFAFPDKVIEQHTDFVCMASANTWGSGATADYVGRNKIDSATLSRFVRIEIGYDEQLEREIVGNHEWATFIQQIRAKVQKEGVKILVTPRHTLQGVALLEAGMSRTDVESYTVFAGLDSDTVARLRRSV